MVYQFKKLYLLTNIEMYDDDNTTGRPTCVEREGRAVDRIWLAKRNIET